MFVYSNTKANNCFSKGPLDMFSQYIKNRKYIYCNIVHIFESKIKSGFSNQAFLSKTRTKGTKHVELVMYMYHVDTENVRLS